MHTDAYTRSMRSYWLLAGLVSHCLSLFLSFFSLCSPPDSRRLKWMRFSPQTTSCTDSKGKKKMTMHAVDRAMEMLATILIRHYISFAQHIRQNDNYEIPNLKQGLRRSIGLKLILRCSLMLITDCILRCRRLILCCCRRMIVQC